MADDLGFISTEDHSDLGFEPHPPAVHIGQQPASIPGVATVMAGQAGRALGAAGEWLNPMNFVNLALHPYESTVGASARSLGAGEKAFGQGQYGESALNFLGALPLVGPPSEQLIRDVGQGNIPEALGHVGAAYLLSKAPKAPEAIKGATETAKTVTKAGTEAAKTTKASKMGAAVGGFTGAGIGQALGHPFIGGDIGAAVGGAYPKVVAGTKAAAKAYRDMGKPAPPPPIDYTMGTGELSIPGVGPKPPTPPPPVAEPQGWTGAPSARGPVAPVEPLKVGGPMPPPVEGTLQPPKPPAPLPPPPKLLPTAAERDAMAAGKMMEQRIAKDVKLAQYFKDQGLDAAAVRKLSDQEFNAHLGANKMRAASKSPSGLHRSLDELREHIASRLEGRPY